MITKINRQIAIKKFPNLPTRQWNPKEEDFNSNFPKTLRSYVLTTVSKSYRGHISAMATEITRLIKELEQENLVFLCDLETPWLSRSHAYKYAIDAQQYLSENKIGKRFNGALQVPTGDLATFIRHLCWLVRTNAILPVVYFTDTKKSFFGTFCQYGNLHISTITEMFDTKLRKEMIKTELSFIKTVCFDKFSKNTGLMGRSTRV
jgi:hypothetical protein